MTSKRKQGFFSLQVAVALSICLVQFTPAQAQLTPREAYLSYVEKVKKALPAAEFKAMLSKWRAADFTGAEASSHVLEDVQILAEKINGKEAVLIISAKVPKNN